MWDKILYLARWVVGVGAFITFSITVYQYFDDIKSKETLNQQEIMGHLKQITDSSKIQYSIINRKIDQISMKQDEMIVNDNVMKKSIIDHVSQDKEVTKEDLYKFMQQIGSELKKNNLGYQPTRTFIQDKP